MSHAPSPLPRRRSSPALPRALALAGAIALLGWSPSAAQDPAPAAPQREERALWVTRYDYRTAADVRRVFADAARLGATRVLFQVRGNASTFYPSRLEPWSERLGPTGPGFDPLALACVEAKRHSLALEAWINLLPLWKGTGQPKDPRHPYRAHPEWVVVGSDGQPQRPNEHYLCANPALPQVRAHVAAVASEIAGTYPVDAIHLDYVRYVLDLERSLDFSRDPISLQAFGGDPDADPLGWSRFKASQVTQTVREVREAIRAARPSCGLSAAVYPTRESRAKVHQDVEAWVQAGLVDALYPMTYADQDEEFARRLRESLPLGAGRVPVYPGVAIRRHPQPAQTLGQIARLRAAGAPGFALFCYSACFASADRVELVTEDAALRAARVEALRGLEAPQAGAAAGSRQAR